LEEQAWVDAGPWAALYVTFRRAAPALGAAALWTAVSVASEIAVTDLFAVRTFAEELYTQNAVTAEPLGPPLALAPAWAMAGSLAALGMAAVAALTPATSRSPTRLPVTFDLGGWRWPAAAIAWMLVAVLAGIPLVSLFVKTGVLVESGPAGLERTWSPAKVVQTTLSMFVLWNGALRPGRVLVELGWSLLVSGLAATLAVTLAAPAAWAARRGGWPALIAGALAGGLLAVPGPAIGIALVWLFNSPPAFALYDATRFDWYSQSIAAPVAAQTLRALPWAGLGLWHALRTTPQAALDVAACDGAEPLAQMLWIGLPSRWPALALAWLGALSAALAELGASLIVRPPAVELLSTWIFRELHFGQEDLVSGASLAMLLVSSLLALVALALVRRLTGQST
jgi:ABC-type Fe3+ transport system permease subunit